MSDDDWNWKNHGAMLAPKGYKAPHAVEVGTDAIGKRAKKAWPKAKVVINAALGEWGWMAISDKVDP